VKNIRLSLSALLGGKDRRDDVVAFLVLAGLWIVVTILVNPLGNFPLHDDFAYGKSVKQLLDTGRFHQPYSGAWWVAEDDYSITFGPMPGYQVEKSYRLKRWLPFGPAQILVLHKAPTGSPPE